MKKNKVKYSDEPIGKIKIVDDFLPKPDFKLLSSVSKNKYGMKKNFNLHQNFN